MGVNKLSIERILIITKAGLPLVSYPEEVSPDQTVFSGILAALVESGKKVGMGEIDNIKMGDKNFLVKNFEEVVIVVTLNSDTIGGRLFLEALYSSMKKFIDFFSFDEGYVNEATVNALRNVIKRYYDAFSELVSKYSELIDVYSTAKKVIGVKAFELTKGFLKPHVEVEEEDGDLKVKSVTIDDPELLVDVIDSAIKNLKRYLASML